MPVNILHIAPDIDLTSGVTRHMMELLKGFIHEKEYKVHLITNRGDAINLLDNNYYPVNVIPFHKGKQGIFTFLQFKKQLENYCAENNIKIIHTHHRYPELTAYYVSKKNKIKTIVTAHSFVSGYKRLSFRSDKIIAVSNAVRDQLVNSYSIFPGKIEKIYNPISFPLLSDDKKELRKNLQIPENKIVLLFVGRISKEKGVDILLESLSNLKSDFENILLIIVGSEKEKNILSQQTFDRDYVRVLPPTENITQFYELSDIVVLPSMIDPFPYVMLEAGWFKKPFIGSKTGGIKEFIEDGVNGFLCEPVNVDDLTKKIKFVIDNKEKAGLAAENLYEKVKLHCSIEKYFSRLTHIYEDLLS